jgi:hypothetical protein
MQYGRQRLSAKFQLGNPGQVIAGN